MDRVELQSKLLKLEGYDFSKYNFNIKYDERSLVICKKHGEQQTRFRELVKGKFCKDCSLESEGLKRRQSLDTFKSKLLNKFPNTKLDLNSINVIYPQHLRIKVLCKEHGEFKTTSNNMLNSNKDPCPKCSNEIRLELGIKGVKKIIDKESFIEEATKKYKDKFSYSNIIYTKLNSIVENILCVKHNHYFSINGGSFIWGCKIGCPICVQEKLKTNKLMTQEEFISRVTELHGTKYDFKETIYKGNSRKVKVKCNTCNNYFYPLANNILRGSSCTYCSEVAKANKWKDTPTSFYVLKIEYKQNILYKIGITIRDIKRRYKFDFKKDIKYELMYLKDFDEGRVPFTLEQRLRGKLYEYNYKGESPFKRTGTNEIFSINPIPYIDGVLQQILKEKEITNE